VTRFGLQSKPFEFTGTGSGVADVGVFQVKRMGDEDRRPVIVKVVDAQGETLAGAAITFSPMINRSSTIPAAKTDAMGRVETRLFPNKYSCYANLAGYNRAFRSIEIAADALEPNTVELKLHRMIKATIKVQWRAKIIGHPNQPQPSGESISTGEIELHNGMQSHDSRTPYSTASWIRLLQKDDQLQLQFTEGPSYGSMGLMGISWIGRVDMSKGPAVDFETINLANLDEWKKKAKLIHPNSQDPPGRRQPIIAAVEKDALYVGKINSRDMQGRASKRFFKILVTELGDSE
jgi:hypothetical protein